MSGAGNGETRVRDAAQCLLARASVEAGEAVAIVATMQTDRSIVESLVECAIELKAVPMVLMTPPVSPDDAFAETPSMVVEGLKRADVVLPLYGFSSYTRSYRAILQRTRVLGLALPPGIEASADQFCSWLLDFDYQAMDALCAGLAELARGTERITMSSPAGTHITMAVGGRRVAADPGKVRSRGDENYLPGSCLDLAPLEESWEGVIVYDSFVFPPIGPLPEAIKLVVRGGTITSIDGGHSADVLRDWLAEFHDKNMYRMSHIGIGLNRGLSGLSGVKNIDERIYGLLGAGIGTNDIPVFGGTIRAKGHTDGYMKCASMEFDGKDVLDHGLFVHPALAELPGQADGASAEPRAVRGRSAVDAPAGPASMCTRKSHL